MRVVTPPGAGSEMKPTRLNPARCIVKTAPPMQL
jgi:hypothetical protein